MFFIFYELSKEKMSWVKPLLLYTQFRAF